MAIKALYQNPNRDGGPLGWLNCNTTCTAMMIAFETSNAKRPSGGDVRKCCLNENGSRDTSGGTKPSQNIDAAKRCWGVTLDGALTSFEDAWRWGSRPDYAVAFSINYAVISGTRFDGSPGFRGAHQILMSGGKVYDPLADGRRPGIPSGPQAWPKDLLRRAAGGYAGIGYGRAVVIIARAPAAKPKKYAVAFEPGAIFVYSDSSSVRTRDPGFTKKTSAPCSPPFLMSWGSGKKRVVEITSGRLAGKRVEPSAIHMRLVAKK
jgi:hypothetical protein